MPLIKRSVYVLFAVLVLTIGVAIAVFGHFQKRVDVNELRNDVSRDIKIGSTREFVEGFLKARHIEYQYVEDSKVPGYRRVLVGNIPNSSKSPLYTGIIYLRFWFDENGQLVSYKVEEVFKGL